MKYVKIEYSSFKMFQDKEALEDAREEDEAVGRDSGGGSGSNGGSGSSGGSGGSGSGGSAGSGSEGSGSASSGSASSGSAGSAGSAGSPGSGNGSDGTDGSDGTSDSLGSGGAGGGGGGAAVEDVPGIVTISLAGSANDYRVDAVTSVRGNSMPLTASYSGPPYASSAASVSVPWGQLSLGETNFRKELQAAGLKENGNVATASVHEREAISWAAGFFRKNHTQ